MAPVTIESWQFQGRLPPFAQMEAREIEGYPGLLLALDHEGLRHLLVRVETSEPPWADERSRGIRASIRDLEVADQPESPFLDVVCLEASGHDGFNLVASAIAEQIAAGAEARQTVSRVLAHWRRFWSSAPSTLLTAEEQRGLFAELWFLAHWLLPVDDRAIDRWFGPTGSRHDFQWSTLAIETKATASVRGHVHRINGLDQLEAPSTGRLLLFSLRLREEVSAQESLPGAIAGIATALSASPESLDRFEVLLSQAGYSPSHAVSYEETHYRVISERLYSVVDHFPRIESTSFEGGPPNGVEALQYDINLDVAPDLIIARTAGEFASSVDLPS